MAIVLVVSRTRATRDPYGDALTSLGQSREYQVRVRENLTHATRYLRRNIASAVLVDWRACQPASEEQGDVVPQDLATFMGNCFETPVLLCAISSWFHPRRVLALAEIGVSEVILLDKDSEDAIDTVLQGLLSADLKESFLRVLPPGLPRDMVDLIEGLLRPSVQPPTVESMARALHADRSTLFRRFRAEGLPPPRTLLGWIRTYLVLRLVEDGIPLPTAAIRLGFASTSAFLRTAEHRVAVDDADLLEQIGSKGVLTLLRAELLRRMLPGGAA